MMNCNNDELTNSAMEREEVMLRDYYLRHSEELKPDVDTGFEELKKAFSAVACINTAQVTATATTAMPHLPTATPLLTSISCMWVPTIPYPWIIPLTSCFRWREYPTATCLL